MKRIRALLELQDYFSIQFHILFKGERKIHSIYSIILSLLINVACGAMRVTLVLELIKHKKPIVNMAELKSFLTENMTLNSKDLLYTWD